MRGTVGVLVGLVIGAVGALTAEKLLIEGRPAPSPVPTAVPTAPPSTLPPAMCDAVVTIGLDASTGKPTATPDIVCLAKDRELSWQIDPQLEAGEIKIEFDVQGMDKGPFPDAQTTNPHNKGRGLYQRAKADKRPIRSNAAERIGRWKYSVTYTPEHGTPQKLDPAVCIRN
jgi:hypothetical protein